jgi:hypothetical protein
MEREITSGLKEKLLYRLKNELEIYILMAIFAVWYLINIGGAIEGDETIFALQGYYFMKGNMPAEQFRPMSRYFYGLGQLMFGRTTFGAKFFIFILGILTIYLTYLVGKTLSNRVYGFMAALILGIIPLYGDLSVSGLMDIILTFFVMLLFFFALKMYRTKNIIKKQRLIFLVGVLSICILATKLYGVFFSLVAFLFLVNVEWRRIRTIKLFKLKNMTRRFKKNLLLIPVFVVLGVLFGLLIRMQLSDLWDDAGDKGRTDILEVLPGFLDNIVENMDSSQAYGFFIILGIVIFMILWMICALIGRESLRIMKYLVKKRALDEKYHVLIYLLGGIIGFAFIYSPYLSNPVALFTQILLNQTIHIAQSSPREVGGVLYETAPWWSYLYWTYIYLSLMFIVGIVISLCYMAYSYIKKEKVAKELSLLLFYTFIPFILLSLLSLKAHTYFVVLFPLFSIFIVVQVTTLVERIGNSSSTEPIKKHTKVFSIVAIVLIMLLPGPLWMMLGDTSLGEDSGYDEAGELVDEYVNDHSGEDIRIIAFDKLGLEFYLPDDVLDKVEIIPLFSDNYSKDILGRPNIYYPEEELYDLVLDNDIDMLVDEPERVEGSDNLIRRYAVQNSTAITYIDDELAIYYLKL